MKYPALETGKAHPLMDDIVAMLDGLNVDPDNVLSYEAEADTMTVKAVRGHGTYFISVKLEEDPEWG